MKQSSEYKLLIVEDSAIQLKLLGRFLASQGYQVLPTTSAREALAMIQEQRPDLVISDLVMPEMSGFELCDIIKRDLALQTIPVILLTSLSEPGDILQGLAVGGDSYVLKPYVEADLLGKIERLLAMSAEEVRAGLKEFASIEYKGEQYSIHADSPRILHFLLTTYENAVEKNRALVRAQVALQESSLTLESQFQQLRDSEQRFESLVGLIPDIIYRIDVEGNFVYLNSAVRQLGYEPDELIGQHFSVMMLPADAESVSRSYLLPKLAGHTIGDERAPALFDERRTGARATRTLEMRLLCKGKAGSERVGISRAVSEERLEVEINSSGFYLSTAKETEKLFLGTVGVVRDITDRKQNEMALRRSEHGLASAQRIAHLGSWEWDIVSNELIWSDEIYRIFGLQPQEFGATYEAFLEAVPPAEREVVKAAVTEALEGPEHEYDIEHHVMHPDGKMRDVHEQAEVILDAKGQPLSLIGTVQDITERKHLEDSLHEYQVQLEEKVKDRTRELALSNEALIQSEHELSVRNSISTIFLSFPDDEMYAEILHNIILPLSVSKYGLFAYVDEEGALVAPSMTRDVWDQCQVADKSVTFPRNTWLNSKAAWAKCLVNAETMVSNESSAMVPEGHISMQRFIFVPIVYQDEIIGQLGVANKESDYDDDDVSMLESIALHIAPLLRTRLERDQKERQRQKGADELREANQGLEKAMDELKATQQYMIQSEKLSSLGTLAAGVAHEMNNPIMGIINYVEFAKKHIEHERGSEMLSRADKELRRVADIVKGMLTFSRPSSEEMSAIDVGETFHHAQQLLATDLRHQNIEMEISIADELPKVLAKSDSLEQVFLNLLMNARDALKKVEVRRIKVDMSLQAGQVVIGICDSGPGIEENILTDIFDPFFTTKPAGKGTGLGLYISRNLVNGFNGELSCAGNLGTGACFTIKLPSIAPVDL